MKHKGKRIPIPFKISKVVTKWRDFPLCSEVIYKVVLFFFFCYSCLVSGMGKRQIIDECAFSDVGGCKLSLWLGEKGRLIVSWSIVQNFDKLLQCGIYTF